MINIATAEKLRIPCSGAEDATLAAGGAELVRQWSPTCSYALGLRLLFVVVQPKYAWEGSDRDAEGIWGSVLFSWFSCVGSSRIYDDAGDDDDEEDDGDDDDGECAHT